MIRKIRGWMFGGSWQMAVITYIATMVIETAVIRLIAKVREDK